MWIFVLEAAPSPCNHFLRSTFLNGVVLVSISVWVFVYNSNILSLIHQVLIYFSWWLMKEISLCQTMIRYLLLKCLLPGAKVGIAACPDMQPLWLSFLTPECQAAEDSWISLCVQHPPQGRKYEHSWQCWLVRKVNLPQPWSPRNFNCSKGPLRILACLRVNLSFTRVKWQWLCQKVDKHLSS